MVWGKLVLLSSGETTPAGGAIFRNLLGPMPKGFRAAILETPAGFELNSARVAQRVADYLQAQLEEKSPRISVIPARRKGTRFSPDSPELLEDVASADLIFLGAGSPTYAVRQLQGSLAWQYVLASWQQGAMLVLASAAAIASGARALPVYEIFKAGEDPDWRAGLDLYGPIGWKLVVVSHWNNASGGEELDTSRCFIGRERFEMLRAMLPGDYSVLGIDENTAVVLDWKAGMGHVEGKGTATLQNGAREWIHSEGEIFSLEELGATRLPFEPFGVTKPVWEEVRHKREAVHATPEPPAEVMDLVREREKIRNSGDYARADILRKKIEGLGWVVMDTPQGTTLKPYG